MDEAGQKFDEFVILGERYQLPRTGEGASRTKNSIVMKATILFAKQGFSSVSMRDIAQVIGIKPASLYNHFGSKEELWQAVLSHAKELYLLYFSHLDERMAAAETFADMLAVIFIEPKRMPNVFTAYAFSLIGAEQYRDEAAAAIFTEIFLKFSIEMISRHFDSAIARNMVPPFDTKTVAATVMHTVLGAIGVTVQQYMGRPVPYDAMALVANLERLVLQAVGVVAGSES